jgi:hypothetical protein
MYDSNADPVVVSALASVRALLADMYGRPDPWLEAGHEGAALRQAALDAALALREEGHRVAAATRRSANDRCRLSAERVAQQARRCVRQGALRGRASRALAESVAGSSEALAMALYDGRPA